MKLVRFGEPTAERPGIWTTSGILDLTRPFPHIPDIGPEFFRQGWPQRLATEPPAGEPDVPANVRLGPPVIGCEKILCLGKNYADHAREGHMSVPDKPLFFCKTPNALSGPHDPILLPVSSGQVDFEVELAVIISTTGKRIPAQHAMDHVAGFCVMNDVSGREAQFGDKQWFRGKSFDTFAPLGPVLATPDEVGNPHALALGTRVNGTVMQQATTADLIFKIPELIAYISQDMTLRAGDIISTGTPAGVGIFRDPPVTLKPGDVVECFVDRIGTLKNLVVQDM